MDTLLSSLIRRYSADQGDHDLAHRIARCVMRSNPVQLNFNEKLDNFNETVESLNQELSGQLESQIQSMIRDNLVGIRWTQYTPYFNDGDACEFSVRNPTFLFKGITSKYDPDDEEGYYDLYDIGGFKHDYNMEEGTWTWRLDDDATDEQRAIAEIALPITELFSKVPESLFLHLYGDHSQVTITADKVEREDYEHD